MGCFATCDNTNQKDFKKQGNFDFTNEGKKKRSFDRDTDNHYVFKIVKKEESEIGFLTSENNDWLTLSKSRFMIIREAAGSSPVGYMVIKDTSSNGI